MPTVQRKEKPRPTRPGLFFALDSHPPEPCSSGPGSPATGTSSYFELVDGVITLAVLGTPELPGYVHDYMRELGR